MCDWSSRRCLDVRSDLSPVLLFLSLFYFLGMEINCRENTSVKYFTGFWGMIYSQRKSFSVWLNFPRQSKHAQWYKIFFENYLLSKQTQLECTHSFMFNENRVDWMYTFIYIFQKLCALIIPNCIPSLKMHIECTHSFMFNKKRVDWMYTFMYIFQKLCVLIIRNYIPSLKNVYIQSTHLWAFNYKSVFFIFYFF